MYVCMYVWPKTEKNAVSVRRKRRRKKGKRNRKKRGKRGEGEGKRRKRGERERGKHTSKHLRHNILISGLWS